MIKDSFNSKFRKKAENQIRRNYAMQKMGGNYGSGEKGDFKGNLTKISWLLESFNKSWCFSIYLLRLKGAGIRDVDQLCQVLQNRTVQFSWRRRFPQIYLVGKDKTLSNSWRTYVLKISFRTTFSRREKNTRRDNRT